MSDLDQRISDVMDALQDPAFASLPQHCGQELERGVDEVEEWREWSHQPPTPDQLRIEDSLEIFLQRDDRVLHIGVGGSDLAARFAPRVRQIVGMTISEQEARRGNTMSLSNYHVLVWNKYKYWPEMPGAFDAIVDNNPTTFACCLRHVLEMFAWYADSLTPRGAIFTDRIGLGWVVTAGDQGWSFDRRMLSDVVAAFDLEVVDIDGSVYGVTGPQGVPRLVRLRRLSVLRSLKKRWVRPRDGMRFLRRSLRALVDRSH